MAPPVSKLSPTLDFTAFDVKVEFFLFHFLAGEDKMLKTIQLLRRLGRERMM